MDIKKRRRDSFDYYDDIYDESYSENDYDIEAKRRKNINYEQDGTVEFTAIKGHGLDINSRPLGNQTMVIDKPHVFPSPYNSGEHHYQSSNIPFDNHLNAANPYNTQRINLDPYTQNQNPYYYENPAHNFNHTQQLNLNPNPLYGQPPYPPYNNLNPQYNPYLNSGPANKLPSNSKNEINEQDKKVEKKEKVVVIKPDPQQHAKIESIEKNNNINTEKINQTQEIVKTNLDKQEEVNKKNKEQQEILANKTQVLQKQVEQLTTTLANVTNNFGKSISNLSNDLRNTQEVLKNQKLTSSFSFKNEFADDNIEIIKKTESSKEAIPKSQPQRQNKQTTNIQYPNPNKNDLFQQQQPQQPFMNSTSAFVVENKLPQGQELVPYSDKTLTDGDINPVKLKDKLIKKGKKRKIKEINKQENNKKLLSKSKKKLLIIIGLVVFGVILISFGLFWILEFTNVTNVVNWPGFGSK